MLHAKADRRRPALYERVCVPLVAGRRDDVVLAEACLVAADGGMLFALVPLEVPRQLPLEAPLPEAEAYARDALAAARAVAGAYDVRVRGRVVRTRAAGPTIVAEAERAGADAVVVAMRRGGRLDPALEYVVRHAACRVLIAAD